MDRGAWQATVRGEARAALIFSRSLGWKLLPAASRQPGQGPCPVPPTCSTVWLHSAPYPSLCAWQSPQDPTPWVFSCQWRLLVACWGLSSPRASAGCSASGVPPGRLGQGGRRLLSLRLGVCGPLSRSLSRLFLTAYAPLLSLSCLMPSPEQELQEAEEGSPYSLLHPH